MIDTAHGHSKKVLKTLSKLKKIDSSIPFCVGNIATGEAAKKLYNSGADIIKIGIGPGSICTTRMVAGIGVPQISAILDVKNALKNKKHVVTANKAVIARFGDEIYHTAKNNGVYVLTEAAVCGGIPIIEPLKRSLKSNQINKMVGIINGTTNFILTKMTNEKADYKETLQLAQKLGFAEFDPSADVGGHDAADKISILTELAFGGEINRDSISTQGIEKINFGIENIFLLSSFTCCLRRSPFWRAVRSQN